MVESQQLAGLGSPGCPATKGNSPSKSWGDLFLNCIHLRPVPLHLPYVSPFPLGSPRKVFSVLQFCLIFSSPRGVAALRGRSSLSPSLCKIIAIAERPLVLWHTPCLVASRVRKRLLFPLFLNFPVFPLLWGKSFCCGRHPLQSCDCSAQAAGAEAFQVPKWLTFLVAVEWGTQRRRTSILGVDVHMGRRAGWALSWPVQPAAVSKWQKQCPLSHATFAQTGTNSAMQTELSG